jgi:hypothetical protein
MRGFNNENRRFLQGSNELKEKSEATVDKKWFAAYSEDTAIEIFFGADGLKDFLIAAGILDPVTNKIAAGRHGIVRGSISIEYSSIQIVVQMQHKCSFPCA